MKTTEQTLHPALNKFVVREVAESMFTVYKNLEDAEDLLKELVRTNNVDDLRKRALDYFKRNEKQ